MKVAFVTSEFPPDNPGGAGISSKLIAEGLDEQGLDVSVFALTGERRACVQSQGYVYELPKDELYPGPKVVGENLSTYFYAPDLSQFDVIHVYNTRHLPACILRSAPPVIATMNNHMWICVDAVQHFREGLPDYGMKRAFKHAKTAGYTGIGRIIRTAFDYLGKKIVRYTDRFTAQTSGMKKAMISAGYNPKDVDVVPNVLDSDFEVDSSNSERKILFVGQLYPNKAPDLVVKAFVNLPKEVRDQWTLKIFGSGPLENKIQSISQEHESADIRLTYCPYADLPQEYASAELLIHSSQYVEPFSRTWLEAMASGTPILCSKNPSSTAVLSDIAEFYQTFDQSDLEAKLKSILESPERRQEMRERGRSAIEKYRPSVVANKYIETYKSVI